MLTEERIYVVNCCDCRSVEMLAPGSVALLDAEPHLFGDLPEWVRLIAARARDRVPARRLPDGRALCRDCAGVANDDDDTDLVFDEAEGEEAGVTSSVSGATPQAAQAAS